MNSIANKLSIKYNRQLYILSIISSFLQVLLAIYLAPLIDRSVSEGHLIYKDVIIYICICLLYVIVSSYTNYQYALISSLYNDHVTNKIVAITTAKRNIAKDKDTLLSILNNDVKRVCLFLDNNLKNLLYQPIVFLMTFVALLFFDVRISLLIIPLIVICSFLNIKVTKGISICSSAIQKAQSNLISVEKEAFENTGYIIGAEIQSYITEKHNIALKNLYLSNTSYAKKKAISYVPALMNEYLPTIVYCMFSLSNIHKHNLDYGRFIAFILLINLVSLPFSKFLRSLDARKGITPIVDTIEKVLDQETVTMEKEDVVCYPEAFSKDHISLLIDNMMFGFSEDKIVFRNFSLTIKEKEKVAIMGLSGFGKSTLLKLIIGYYVPWAGTIATNGYDTVNEQAKVLESVGYVDTDYFIFPESIRFNITLSHSIEYDEKYEILLKQLDLDDLSSFRSTTRLSQAGVDLSGGQKMKICLARALYKDPALYIFDEFTASLDKDNEELALQLIRKLERTVIATTHRVSTAIRFDRVIVIDEHGNIAQDGDPAILIKQEGLLKNAKLLEEA